MRGILRYTLVWGARYTLGARYLSKNTVFYRRDNGQWTQVATMCNRKLYILPVPS